MDSETAAHKADVQASISDAAREVERLKASGWTKADFAAALTEVLEPGGASKRR